MQVGAERLVNRLRAPYGGWMFRTIRRYQLVTDLVVAAAFFLLQLVTLGSGRLSAVVLLVFSVSLALRRLAPGLALAVAWLGALVQMVSLLESPQFYDLAVLAVLFTTSAYGSRLVRWIGLGSAVLGSLFAALYLVFLNGGPNTLASTLASGSIGGAAVLLFGLLAVLGLSWTLGLLARTVQRSRESRAAQAAAEQVVVIEQERNRIARDMHDVVAHSLAVVIAQADGARYARESDPAAVDGALSSISATAREALGNVRILLSQLRHSQGETPQPALVDLERLIEQMRSSGLQISQQETGPPVTVSTGHQLAIFRIVQEALTNALRHGDAGSPVVLAFAWEPELLSLEISNSLGMTSRAEPNPGGHGLAGMRERAILAGGELTAGVDGAQYRVDLQLPIPAKRAQS